jgi:predicted GNAT family acetyltransferase
MKELLEELNVEELMSVKGGKDKIKIKCTKTNSGVICSGSASAISMKAASTK